MRHQRTAAIPGTYTTGIGKMILANRHRLKDAAIK
jgi:hypothetical protein